VTKHELENGWTLDAVMDAHDALDLFHDYDVVAANASYLESLGRKGARRG
jgi:hypothetical protein